MVRVSNVGRVRRRTRDEPVRHRRDRLDARPGRVSGAGHRALLGARDRFGRRRRDRGASRSRRSTATSSSATPRTRCSCGCTRCRACSAPDPVGVAIAPDAVVVFHDGDTLTILPELSAPPTAPGAVARSVGKPDTVSPRDRSNSAWHASCFRDRHEALRRASRCNLPSCSLVAHRLRASKDDADRRDRQRDSDARIRSRSSCPTRAATNESASSRPTTSPRATSTRRSTAAARGCSSLIHTIVQYPVTSVSGNIVHVGPVERRARPRRRTSSTSPRTPTARTTTRSRVATRRTPARSSRRSSPATPTRARRAPGQRQVLARLRREQARRSDRQRERARARSMRRLRPRGEAPRPRTSTSTDANGNAGDARLRVRRGRGRPRRHDVRRSTATSAAPGAREHDAPLALDCATGAGRGDARVAGGDLGYGAGDRVGVLGHDVPPRRTTPTTSTSSRPRVTPRTCAFTDVDLPPAK